MALLSDVLSDFFPWDEKSSLNNQTTIILDSDSGSGEFAFAALIVKLIKCGTPIALLSTNHSRSHYTYILRKYGLELRKLEEENKVSYFSLQPNVLETESKPTLTLGLVGGVASLTIDGLQAVDVSDSASREWSQLLPWLSEACSQRGRLLLVDDLDCFEFMAPSFNLSRVLLSSWCNGVAVPAIAGQCSVPLLGLVAFGRCSRLSLDPAVHECPLESILKAQSSTSNAPTLTEYCRYRSDVTVEVCPLATGYSSEVHGIIRINGRLPVAAVDLEAIVAATSKVAIGRPQSQLLSCGVSEVSQTLHFKALDSGIRCSVVSR